MTVFQTIRDLVADAEQDELTVKCLADAALARVDDPRAALVEAMPVLVRVVLKERAPGPVKPPQSTNVLPVRSHKVASVREAWRRRLEEAYSIGHDGATWKRLGDMTADDLDWLAGASERLANAHHARAKGWRDLAALVQAEGVACVRDLPEAVLTEALEPAA